MLKTNSKQFYNNLDKYVIENMQETAEGYEVEKPQNAKEAYLLLWKIYKEEYLSPCWFGTAQNFEDWGRGLPAGALFDFLLCRAVDTLGDMLEETEEERARFTEQQAEKVLFNKIFSRMVKNIGDEYFIKMNWGR